MLIPATISLFVSAIILNFGFAFNCAFFNSASAESPKAGLVLGVSEQQTAGQIIVLEGGNFSQAIVKVIQEAKTSPLGQFFQFSQPARQLPENQGKEPVPQAVNFDLAAENGAVLDSQNDYLFFSKKPDQPRPIASITKLFTAFTFLDFNPGWETSYEIKAADKREGGKIYLFAGDKVKIKDLFYFSLVGSDNTATAALVQATGLSEEEFVQKINDKIKELGFINTKLVDVAGLREANISTAREIAKFANLAFADPEISRASLTKKYEFTTEQGRKKTISNTNELLNIFPEQEINILGGKTGHINSSGYCLVSKFKDQAGRTIVTVVLGADSDSGRFGLTKKLVELYYGVKP